MQFLFPALAWGFLLVLVPLLVHLINLLRHRRQRWAAMEFLLESYRKHRRWVWLKQALLLLSRMAVMAILVAMLAQWISGASWLNLLGETTTHHYILLDDSYSMSDTSQGSSAYQKGLAAIGAILRSAGAQGNSHQVTLIRASRAAIAGDGPEGAKEGKGEAHADVAADLLARSIPRNPLPLLDRLMTTHPTAMDVSLESALHLIGPLIESSSNQQAVVYMVSDFRKKEWSQPESLRTKLETLRSKQARIELIDCVDAQHQNLTVDSVEPEQEVLAAGVPLMVRVQVRNHGTAIARDVRVRIKMVEYPDQGLIPRPEQATSGKETELPPLVIDEIRPGELASRRFQALFLVPGSHVIEASLADDSVDVDNRGRCTIRIEEGQRVLLVDGDAAKRNAFFLDAIMNPGSNTKTGLLTRREGPEFLRDTSVRELAAFSSIILMNLDRLDPRSLTNLDEYAKLGGGIALFFGDDVREGSIPHYNEDWYKNGTGLLPCKLIGISQLSPTKEEGEADLIPQPHPILLPLTGLRNSPFQFLRISRYVSAQFDVPKSNSERETVLDENSKRPIRWIAKLRNGDPWAIDAPYHQGRVIVFLTGLSLDWNNWAQDPTFVVTALKMVGFLGSFRGQETSQRIGSENAFSYSSRDILPTLTAILPANKETGSRVALDFTSEKDSEGFFRGTIQQAIAEQPEDVRNMILNPGIVELWRSPLQGERRTQNYVLNVAPAEGDLAKPSSDDIKRSLRPVDVQFRQADSMQASSVATALSTRNTLLMMTLLGLLFLEQFLAWSTSYHLPKVARGGSL